jgi:hypothetical protein
MRDGRTTHEGAGPDEVSGLRAAVEAVERRINSGPLTQSGKDMLFGEIGRIERRILQLLQEVDSDRPRAHAGNDR